MSNAGSESVTAESVTAKPIRIQPRRLAPVGWSKVTANPGTTPGGLNVESQSTSIANS
jgi:hypothetical protein